MKKYFALLCLAFLTACGTETSTQGTTLKGTIGSEPARSSALFIVEGARLEVVLNARDNHNVLFRLLDGETNEVLYDSKDGHAHGLKSDVHGGNRRKLEVYRKEGVGGPPIEFSASLKSVLTKRTLF